MMSPETGVGDDGRERIAAGGDAPELEADRTKAGILADLRGSN
jgi:hypothetical protein